MGTNFWVGALAWLDARPQHWVVASGAGLLTILLALLTLFLPAKPVGRGFLARAGSLLARSRFAFLAAALATLCAFRLPAVFFPLEINADESNFIAQAMTVARVPGTLPWRDYDGLTSGPLDVWALLPASWLGLPFGHPAARGTGLLLAFGGLVAVHAALRKQFSEPTARLGTLPALSFLALTDFEFFQHYSSERVAMFLLAVAFSILAGSLLPKQSPDGRRLAVSRSAGRMFLAGGILGLVPYAKLQAAPVAAALSVAGFALIRWGNSPPPAPWRKRQTAAFALGGVLPSVGFLGALALAGELHEFWFSYVKAPLFYVGLDRSPWPAVWAMFLLPDFAAFAFPAVLAGLLAVGAAAFGRRAGAARHAWLVGMTTLWFLASLYVVLQPGRPVTHYMLFLALPLTTLVGVAHGVVAAAGGPSKTPTLSLKLLGVFFLTATVLPGVVTRLRGRENPYVGDLRAFLAWPRGPVAQAMVEAANLGTADQNKEFSAAVWGWAPELFLQSGATLGTRDAVCQFQIPPTAIRPHYQQRFLRDLQRNRPAVFVEAVGPTQFLYQDRAQHGFEIHPELAEWIGTHYELFREVNHERVYRRRD